MVVWGPDSTSGHLQLLQEKLATFTQSLCVTVVTVMTGHTRLVLLEMTISAILATMKTPGPVLSTLMILYGMELGVAQTAPAVSSTAHPGSVRPSPSPPLMTWRSGSLATTHQLHC